MKQPEANLPSNIQVKRILFFNLRIVKLSLGDNPKFVTKAVFIFWEKAWIQTKTDNICIYIVGLLYKEWREFQKTRRKNNIKSQDFYLATWCCSFEQIFISYLHNIFDIYRVDALDIIKIEKSLTVSDKLVKNRSTWFYVFSLLWDKYDRRPNSRSEIGRICRK